jgi:hypothetical protein
MSNKFWRSFSLWDGNLTNITVDFAEKHARAAGHYRQNLVDTHGCFWLNEASGNEEEGEKGLFASGDE